MKMTIVFHAVRKRDTDVIIVAEYGILDLFGGYDEKKKIIGRSGA